MIEKLPIAIVALWVGSFISTMLAYWATEDRAPEVLFAMTAIGLFGAAVVLSIALIVKLIERVGEES